jgi:hypothetical protein
MTFTCVNDRAHEEMLGPLRDACRSRGVAYRQVEARAFDFDPAGRLSAGDLMFRPVTTQLALRVEQFLYAPGVATFYGGSNDRIFFLAISQPLLFARAGLAVPPTIYCATSDRAQLDSWVKRLGGYPVLAKMGGQGGVGVVMLASQPALYAFVDYALGIGREPALSAFVRDALMWRVLVVGERAVAAYTCYPGDGDFRAGSTNDASVFTTEPPPAVGKLAVDAVRATRLEFGGVDVLETVDGCYVLESNFPCNFYWAEIEGGIPVAGPMLDHLIAKAGRLAKPQTGK